MNAASWLDHIKVHPAADLFPMMSDDELDALGKDIRDNGLRHPIIIYLDRIKPERRKDSYPATDEMVVLDGRNRLSAMERVGIRLFDDETGLFSPDIQAEGYRDP